MDHYLVEPSKNPFSILQAMKYSHLIITLFNFISSVMFSLLFHFQEISLQKGGHFMNRVTKTIECNFQSIQKSFGIVRKVRHRPNIEAYHLNKKNINEASSWFYGSAIKVRINLS